MHQMAACSYTESTSDLFMSPAYLIPQVSQEGESTFEYYNVYEINFIVLKVTSTKKFIWHAMAKNGTQWLTKGPFGFYLIII